jgi:hypothetical protein
MMTVMTGIDLIPVLGKMVLGFGRIQPRLPLLAGLRMCKSTTTSTSSSIDSSPQPTSRGPTHRLRHTLPHVWCFVLAYTHNPIKKLQTRPWRVREACGFCVVPPCRLFFIGLCAMRLHVVCGCWCFFRLWCFFDWVRGVCEFPRTVQRVPLHFSFGSHRRGLRLMSAAHGREERTPFF